MVLVRGSGLAVSLVLVGCGGITDAAEGTDPSSTSSADETGSSTTESIVGWFEIGFGDTAFAPLVNGDTLQVVWGGQGAAMFPLPLRGAEFTLPDPPDDYTSELAPLFDLDVDIEGYNDGPGGHFKHLANYPITFEIMPDGSYEYIYVAVLLPDEIDPTVLDGLPAHLSARLRPYGSADFEVELDLVVAGAAAPN